MGGDFFEKGDTKNFLGKKGKRERFMLNLVCIQVEMHEMFTVELSGHIRNRHVVDESFVW